MLMWIIGNLGIEGGCFDSEVNGIDSRPTNIESSATRWALVEPVTFALRSRLIFDYDRRLYTSCILALVTPY